MDRGALVLVVDVCGPMCVLDMLIDCQARFPFKRSRLRCVRCVNETRNKRKRLRWQAANYGCHCFDRAFLLAGACVC